MKLEAIILSEIAQKRKVKYYMSSLIRRRQAVGTHGHTEWNNRHWRLRKVGGWEEGQGWKITYWVQRSLSGWLHHYTIYPCDKTTLMSPKSIKFLKRKRCITAEAYINSIIWKLLISWLWKVIILSLFLHLHAHFVVCSLKFDWSSITECNNSFLIFFCSFTVLCIWKKWQ